MAVAKHSRGPAPYASSGDFHRIFYEETDSLHRLAFLLTADREKAERCFVSGLADSANGSTVFKEWATSWARRTIIQNAVRVINPHPMDEHTLASFDGDGATLAMEQAETAAILQLGPFERFVYVMSVLERYSEQDCSVILACTRQEVTAARRCARPSRLTFTQVNGEAPAKPGFTTTDMPKTQKQSQNICVVSPEL